MISLLLRLLKRLALFVPILAVAYLSIFHIFPWFEDDLPLVFAILATYGLGAYVLVPALIRLARILLPARHLPLYCITPDGFASDPLNIGLIGTQQEVLAAMQRAGWLEADKKTWHSALRYVAATLARRQYPSAPMSSLYMFGRRQDLAFETAVKNQSGGRHHVRFWATNFNEAETLSVQNINWQQRRAYVQNKRLLWVGAASLDVGISFVRHNAQLTHMVDPDTNAERELIAKQLTKAGVASDHLTITLAKPYRLANRALKSHLHSDGKMKVLELTN